MAQQQRQTRPKRLTQAQVDYATGVLAGGKAARSRSLVGAKQIVRAATRAGMRCTLRRAGELWVVERVTEVDEPLRLTPGERWGIALMAIALALALAAGWWLPVIGW